MPTLDVRELKEYDNTDLLAAIHRNASPDYQRRIPEPTKVGLQENLQNLASYRPAWNEFLDALINRIGLVLVKNNMWTNPLAKWKRGLLADGDTIEEINVGLIEAKAYNVDREAAEKILFGTHRPDVQVSYHKVNRRDRYDITVNEPLLRQAFINEQGGLQKFVGEIMSSPARSAQWDEFLLMCALLPEYYKAGGFFKVQVDDVTDLDSTAAEAKGLLRRIRGYATTLAFMNTAYNAAGMPMAVNPDELELIVTPEAQAAIDVEALAAAFNIDKQNVNMRVTVIPAEYWGIEGAQAILTTRDFWVVADQRIETASMWNPALLQNNYFFHHWQVISASRFVPAILFTTEAGDVIEIDETPVTSLSTLSLVDGDDVVVTDVERGHNYQLIGTAVTTPADGYNDAVRVEVVGNTSSHTYTTVNGVLYVAPDEEATTLTLRVTSVDNNDITGDLTVDVVGDLLTLWPNPHVEDDDDLDGLIERTPEDLTMEDNIVVIPTVEGVQYKKAGVNVNNGSSHTIVGTVAFTAVARTGSELAVGAPDSWSFTAV